MATSDFSAASIARLLDRGSDDLKREAVQVIETSAVTMRDRVQQRFAVGRTGVLRGRVFVSSPRGYTTTGQGVVIPTRVVRATAPHVHIYQEGTRERFDATRKNARRGKSPRHGRIFERTAIEVRTAMVNRLQQLADQPREIG